MRHCVYPPLAYRDQSPWHVIGVVRHPESMNGAGRSPEVAGLASGRGERQPGEYEREQLADQREHEADQREHQADHREQLADQREQLADQREKQLYEFAHEMGMLAAERRRQAFEIMERTRFSLASARPALTGPKQRCAAQRRVPREPRRRPIGRLRQASEI